MVRFTRGRRELLAEKFADLANFAVAGLVFGQETFSPAVGFAGMGLWLVFLAFALRSKEAGDDHRALHARGHCGYRGNHHAARLAVAAQGSEAGTPPVGLNGSNARTIRTINFRLAPAASVRPTS